MNAKVECLSKKIGTTRGPVRECDGRLSVVMIVKDEADNMEGALSTFIPFADEIIINDTGSTDGTITKAIEVFTALDYNNFRIIKSAWQEDFSLARNQALSCAHCSWVIWLDADDRIPTSEVEKINKLKTAPCDRFFSFKLVNIHSGLPIGSSCFQTRMFPNHGDMKWQDPIHEQIIYACAELGLHNKAVPVTIHHWGYNDEDGRRGKAERNMKLMERLDVYEQIPAKMMMKANSYYQLKRYEEGIELLKRLWAYPDLNRIDYDLWYTVPAEIGMGYLKQKEYETAIEWYDKAPETSLEANYWKGFCFYRLMKYKECVIWFQKAIECKEPVTKCTTDFHTCRLNAYNFLGQVLSGLGEYKTAIDIYHRMHELYPGIKIQPEDD